MKAAEVGSRQVFEYLLQKGITIDQLAVTDGVNPNPKTKKTAEPGIVNSETEIEIAEDEMSPTQMRSRADALFKQAQVLRKQSHHAQSLPLYIF